MRSTAFICDRPKCKNSSLPAENFTEARKVAEADGWFIRPVKGNKVQHICPACVDAALYAGVPSEF